MTFCRNQTTRSFSYIVIPVVALLLLYFVIRIAVTLALRDHEKWLDKRHGRISRSGYAPENTSRPIRRPTLGRLVQQRWARFSMMSSNIVGDLVVGRHWAAGSIQGGALMYGTPRIIRNCQPEVSIVRWWLQQSKTPLSV